MTNTWISGCETTVSYIVPKIKIPLGNIGGNNVIIAGILYTRVKKCVYNRHVGEEHVSECWICAIQCDRRKAKVGHFEGWNSNDEIE